MITDLDLIICGRKLHLSKGQILQLMVDKDFPQELEAAYTSLIGLWDISFPTIESVWTDMPQKYEEILLYLVNRINHLFWDADEDTPYNHKILESFPSALANDDKIYDILDQFEDHAQQIFQEAKQELYDTNSVGIGQSSFGIGFGLEGIIGLGLARAGANLINRGIQSVSQKRIIQRYQVIFEDLRQGKDTKELFQNVLLALVTQLSLAIKEEIAREYGIITLEEAEEEIDWNPDYPSYRRKSLDEKIDFCISALEVAPRHAKIYHELVQLTKGKEPSVIEFGKAYLQPKVVETSLRKTANTQYEIAKELPESTPEEIQAKLVAIQGARDLVENEDSDSDIDRLNKLLEQAKSKEMALAIRHEIVEAASKMQDLRQLMPKEMRDNGVFVFLLEEYYSSQNYRNLPPFETVRKLAVAGNPIPLLMYYECQIKNNGQPEAIDIWSEWARKQQPYALLRLGLCRIHGRNIEKDNVRGQQLITQSIRLSYPPALFIANQMSLGKYTPSLFKTDDSRGLYADELQSAGWAKSDFAKYLSLWN